MADVNVTRSAVKKAMSSCVAAANELKNASQNMIRQYQAAGTGWKDSKYAELGSIVSECNNAMKEPVNQLQGCYQTLGQLDAILEAYENA